MTDKSSVAMDDTIFQSIPDNSDAFTSVAFDGDTSIDSNGLNDDGDYSEADDDVDSFASYNDIEDPQQATDQASVVSHKQLENGSSSHHSRSSTSTRSVYIQRHRSEYAARRCKSVDMMRERYMIHADEFYYDEKADEERKRRRKICFRAILVVLMIAGFIFALENAPGLGSSPLPTNSSPPTDNTNTSVAAPNAYEDAVTVKVQNTNSNLISSNLVEVPFANHHNLRFDGLLFVKDDTSSGSSRTSPSYTSGSNGEQQQSQYSFDSYAKTLDPVTEFHFSPGESDTTKHVVLTTTVPDLFTNNGLDQHPQMEMANDPGLVLSIGLEPNGQLWLPRQTGQNVLQYEVESDHHSSKNSDKHHHKTAQSHDDGITKNIYGPGDRFVLIVTEDAISLFRNDHHELVGMWMNPRAAEEQSIFQPKSVPQGLYAQIWFKEPKSSMLATAYHDVYNQNGFH